MAVQLSPLPKMNHAIALKRSFGLAVSDVPGIEQVRRRFDVASWARIGSTLGVPVLREKYRLG